jgi:hypothetical protein
VIGIADSSNLIFSFAMSSAVEINIDENSIPRDHLENAMIDSQLHECVKQDNTEDLKRRSQQHLTEKLVTPCGNTLLHVAVSYRSDNLTNKPFKIK